MFTGIVEHTGIVTGKEGPVYSVSADRALVSKLHAGTSVSVNGVCTTVLRKKGNQFFVEIMPETEKRSAFKKLTRGVRVNLELPATASTFLSGHIVQGHVDGAGIVTKIEREGNSRLLTVEAPASVARYVVEKGSIAVHGVSLTVVKTRGRRFTVGIIPYTRTHTTLGALREGDAVNLEADVLAKYVERFGTRV